MATTLMHHSYTTPTSSPVLWLRADKGVTVDGNGKVSLWENQGSGGATYNASQSTTSNRPLLVQNSLNGKPSLFFDGVNDYLSLTTEYQMVNQYTIFSVFQKFNGYTFIPIGKSTVWNYLIGYGSDEVIYMKPGTNTLLFGTSTQLTNFNIYTGVNNNETLSAYRNSIQIGTNQTSNNDYQTLDNIGVNNSVAYNYGNLAEIIVYHQVLSDSERQSVEQYLMKKYAL